MSNPNLNTDHDPNETTPNAWINAMGIERSDITNALDNKSYHESIEIDGEICSIFWDNNCQQAYNSQDPDYYFSGRHPKPDKEGAYVLSENSTGTNRKIPLTNNAKIARSIANIIKNWSAKGRKLPEIINTLWNINENQRNREALWKGGPDVFFSDYKEVNGIKISVGWDYLESMDSFTIRFPGMPLDDDYPGNEIYIPGEEKEARSIFEYACHRAEEGDSVHQIYDKVESLLQSN